MGLLLSLHLQEIHITVVIDPLVLCFIPLVWMGNRIQK